ncbi:M24 family metallopeptidase [Escherichia coli]
MQTLGFEGQQVSWETAHRWKSNSMPNRLAPRRMCCGKSKRQRRWRDASPVDADRGAEQIRRFIQAGMSEREIAAELEWFMRQQGAEKASFDTIVASGWRGRCRTAKPATRLLQRASLSLSIFGALYQGDRSDMTRTLLVNGERG